MNIAIRNGKMKTARSGAINTASSLTNLSIKEINMAKSSLPETNSTNKARHHHRRCV